MPMFGLADVNSFYASCEALFRPDLRGKPIVVLSNNDGCVIARNICYLELTILRLCFLTRKESVCVHRCWHLYLT